MVLVETTTPSTRAKRALHHVMWPIIVVMAVIGAVGGTLLASR